MSKQLIIYHDGIQELVDVEQIHIYEPFPEDENLDSSNVEQDETE